MSRKHSTGRRRSAFVVATAAGGAMAAAMLSMGTAHADTPYVDPYTPPDPYDVLFGAEGTQGADNATLDTNLALSNPTGDLTFYNDVVSFEDGSDHALQNLINAIDPSAFYEQTSVGITGTLVDSGGAYLVPDSTLGYLATGLDAGLLTPVGLDYILTPLIDILLGQG
jgi:hypothetical protein